MPLLSLAPHFAPVLSPRAERGRTDRSGGPHVGANLRRPGVTGPPPRADKSTAPARRIRDPAVVDMLDRSRSITDRATRGSQEQRHGARLRPAAVHPRPRPPGPAASPRVFGVGDDAQRRPRRPRIADGEVGDRRRVRPGARAAARRRTAPGSSSTRSSAPTSPGRPGPTAGSAPCRSSAAASPASSSSTATPSPRHIEAFDPTFVKVARPLQPGRRPRPTTSTRSPGCSGSRPGCAAPTASSSAS